MVSSSHNKLLIKTGLVFCTGIVLIAAYISNADTNLQTAGAMAKAADEFSATLSAEQKKKAFFTFEDSERTNWNFVPLQDKAKNPTRKGLRMEEMSGEQKQLALSMVQAGTSKEGYSRVRGIMGLEQVLKENEKNGTNVRSSDWYFVSVFGTPGAGKKWGWRFEGHHLSLNFVIEGNKVVSATPSFFGANPALVLNGDKKGLRTLPETEDFAKKLISSLSEDQKKVAFTDKLFSEIEQGKSLAPTFSKGLESGALNPEQKKIVQEMIRAYSNRFPQDFAEKEAARLVGSDFAKIDFSYALDKSKPGDPYTYRLQGPDFLIEFINMQADASGNPANHIHSAWRASKGDFGNRN
ncbi:MAG: DUF3500 domain-containing protein [Planctomycetota bacterium]